MSTECNRLHVSDMADILNLVKRARHEKAVKEMMASWRKRDELQDKRQEGN